MLEEIRCRRSIRKYQNKEVEAEKVEMLLRVAMKAPTAKNTQSWRFMVITNRQALDSMVEIQPYTSMMKTAPMAIMVLGDRNANPMDEYLYIDGAAAIENMLLEAVHLGLGTCWCAIGPSPERIAAFRQVYQIEEHLLPIAVVAVGYGDEVKEEVDRYDATKVSWYR